MRTLAAVVPLGVLSVLVGLAVALSSSLPPANAAGDGDSKYDYEGSKSCKKCHSATYKSWEDTAHGKAFETLKPGNAVEAKKKFDLDPNKDYSKDEKCLKCHTVGFGHESGYSIPDESDKKAVRNAAKFEGVGCENCHGPGEEYVKVFKEIMTSKRNYKVDELYSVGLVEVNEQTCTTCHSNPESPTFIEGAEFNFEEMKKKGVHEHEELKQKEG